jgi:hypothetical protein
LNRSLTIILLIPLAFIVGAIASDSLAFAAKETMGKPFLEIWDAMPKIYTIKSSVTVPPMTGYNEELKCKPGSKIYTIKYTETVPAMTGYTEELTCKSGFTIIGTNFDTDISIFTTEIDNKNQKFSVFVFNNDKSPKELHISLSCLAV